MAINKINLDGVEYGLGGGKLYRHNIAIALTGYMGASITLYFDFYSTNSIPFEKETFIQTLINKLPQNSSHNFYFTGKNLSRNVFKEICLCIYMYWYGDSKGLRIETQQYDYATSEYVFNQISRDDSIPDDLGTYITDFSDYVEEANSKVIGGIIQ